MVGVVYLGLERLGEHAQFRELFVHLSRDGLVLWLQHEARIVFDLESLGVIRVVEHTLRCFGQVC